MTILKLLWEAALQMVCCFIEMIGVITNCISKVLDEVTVLLGIAHHRVARRKPRITKSTDVKVDIHALNR